MTVDLCRGDTLPKPDGRNDGMFINNSDASEKDDFIKVMFHSFGIVQLCSELL